LSVIFGIEANEVWRVGMYNTLYAAILFSSGVHTW